MRMHLIVAVIGLLFVSGCQTVPYQGEARNVKLKPQQSGIIALPLNPRPEDRMKAQEKMKMNCGPNQYKVLEEGEVAIGQKTQSSGRTHERSGSSEKVGSIFGLPVVASSSPGEDRQSTQVTRAIKEWQISYKCLSQNESSKASKVR